MKDWHAEAIVYTIAVFGGLFILNWLCQQL